MAYEFIRVTTEAAIATITLNRPEKRNAMHAPMIRELIQALREMEANADIRVVLLNAAGEHFCAGADIAAMQAIANADEDQNYDDAQLLADLMLKLYHFSKPTIVLAQGVTLGGGLGLLCACDIALASDNAQFGFSEVKIGIAPSVVSPYVIAAIGERAAHYYFLTGERFNAETAQRIGLIHQIKTDDLQHAGLQLAKTLLSNSPRAMMEVKKLLRYVAKEKINERLAQLTAEHLAELRSSEEAQEGLLAFLEKRKPKW
jgi:methylglutaconyl-CoA hydratase